MDASEDVDHQKLVEFEKMTEHPAEVQAQVLADILHLNAGVGYLARCGFNSSSSSSNSSYDVVASFKAHVPVVSNAAIKDDLQRIADGDRGPILTAQPVISLTLRQAEDGALNPQVTANHSLSLSTCFNFQRKVLSHQCRSDSSLICIRSLGIVRNNLKLHEAWELDEKI
ncbi:hypothetical protein O6H91_21G066700 [Diphasiastrum complanatum]|uniref:Uncharacterized protein n=1 Tax=Diphasiastrum complanatum TaxID=34168 RepID=A0ACC2ALF3_DIPCM|nr:hypothetical protein O6H91_21G066700 [Diphasiastrum complanatum]